jgi:metal-responsive CopG/Arc/MetJ family transcriptional regulator
MMTSYDAAMRTIVDLPEDQLRALSEVCRRDKISRAEAIRRAVAQYARRRPPGERDRAFGLWRRRRLDSLQYQRKLRREW